MSSAEGEALYALIMQQGKRVVYQLGTQDAAQDVLHDVYASVARAIQSGKRIDNVRAYVRAAVHIAVAGEIHRRQRNRGMEVEHPERRADPGPDPETALIEREQRDLAIETVGDLPEACRQVVVRSILCEHPREKVQADLGITSTQFRLQKSRGVDRCRRAFRRNSIFGRRRDLSLRLSAA